MLLPLAVALFIFGRYCCCCMRPGRCSFLRCGTAAPTRKSPCCGFTDLSDGTVGYPLWERACTYALMFVFLGLGSALVVVGNLYGNYAWTPALVQVTKEGDGAALMAQSAIPPLMDFVIGLADEAVRPLLLR